MHRTFNEFKSTRTRTTLQALIDTGCDAAKSYADCSDEPLDQAEVFAYKTNSDGSQSPYELNCTYFDALSIPGDDALSAQRFLLSKFCIPVINNCIDYNLPLF